MRAAPIALMLIIGSQAGAECGKLCDKEWWKLRRQLMFGLN
jgi:hypothetical protein